MKLTTKRDWRYFRRETFTYMIPIILIVGTINVFFTFMQCPLHPEYSAPCNIIWMNAAIYGIFLIITIIFAIFSSNKLRNVKKKIEVEFLETTHESEKLEKEELLKENTEKIIKEVKESKPKKITVKKEKETKPKKTIVKKDKKSDKKDTADKKISKKTTTKKTTTKKTVAKK